MIIYSLTSGAVAMVIGAAVSLIAPDCDRLALWVTATAIAAVSAGLIYHSDLMKACRFACLRLLHRLTRG